jgi:cation transport ATPase
MLGQLRRGGPFQIKDDGLAAGNGDVISVRRIADEARHLMTRDVQLLGEMQRDLSMPTRDDDAHVRSLSDELVNFFMPVTPEAKAQFELGATGSAGYF